MIARQNLADALARLDPRAREVLDYSLRRKVPDADLATVFQCEPSEVARMRADAIEWLANDLQVQRGADLGQVLTALLEHETWELEPTSAAERRGASADAPPEGSAESPSTDDAPPARSAPAGASPEAEDARAPEVAAEDKPAPVLGMLARGGEDPGVERRGVRRALGARSWSILAGILITALFATGIVAIFVLGEDAGGTGSAAQNTDARPFTPRPHEVVGDPFPADPESANRYPIAVIDRAQTLYDRPGGTRLVKVTRETEWGSPRVLSVVKREGNWLAVLVPELENGRSGWIRERDVDRLATVSWAIKADLSKRAMVVERDGKVVRRIRVGIGRSDHPTPRGRFAVTDKLEVADRGSPYGCCVLALTGHQPKLPLGWPGGDRLAIHATKDLSGIGRPVSLGCMRVHPDQARWLIDSVPLGTPVFISK